MTHVTCRLTAKKRYQLRDPTLGNRVWAAFIFFSAMIGLRGNFLTAPVSLPIKATENSCSVNDSGGKSLPENMRRTVNALGCLNFVVNALIQSASNSSTRVVYASYNSAMCRAGMEAPKCSNVCHKRSLYGEFLPAAPTPLFANR